MAMSNDEDQPLESMRRRLFPEAHEPAVSSSPSGEDGFLVDGDDAQAVADYEQEVITSPTSVTIAFGACPDWTSKSTILMGDEGAEVALHDLTGSPVATEDTNSGTFSTESFAAVRTSSLLDVERTPKKSPMRSHRTANLFVCGGNDMLLDCDGGGQAFIERTIQTFLEDSVASPDRYQNSCTDWQAWSYFGFGGPSQESNVEPSPSKEDIRSVLRSRTSRSLRARKSAIRQLSKDLAPFANSPARSPIRAPALFRNRSFSISEQRPAHVRVSKDKEPMRNRFTEVLQLCTMPENTTLESPGLVRRDPSGMFRDEDVSYDSDPEDFTRRRFMTEKSFRGDDASRPDRFHHRGNSVPSFSPSRAVFDIHNDEVFATIVQEIFNQTTTLVLHPFSDSFNPRYTATQPTRPVAVDAWLERGQHLAYALIQPKWMWKAKPRESTGFTKFQNVNLQGIELLDITRILRMEDVEGSNQPFARACHCFLVKSIDNEELCFEAQSVEERDRLVYSLKLVIARFGAKVLVGDPGVYWEFFSMIEAAPDGLSRLNGSFELE